MALKRLRRNIRTLKTKKETKTLIKIKDPRSGKTLTWAGDNKGGCWQQSGPNLQTPPPPPHPLLQLHKKRMKNNVLKKWGKNENIWLNKKSWTSYGVLASITLL